MWQQRQPFGLFRGAYAEKNTREQRGRVCELLTLIPTCHRVGGRHEQALEFPDVAFVWGQVTKNQTGEERVSSKWKTTRDGPTLPATPVTSPKRGQSLGFTSPPCDPARPDCSNGVGSSRVVEILFNSEVSGPAPFSVPLVHME